MIRGEKIYRKTLHNNPSMLLSKGWRDKIFLVKPYDFKTIIKPFSIKLDVHVTNAYKKDLDNLVKGALDLLTDKHIIHDEKLAYNIEATKHSVDRPFLEKFDIQIYLWVRANAPAS